jgi:hypothetical protein
MKTILCPECHSNDIRRKVEDLWVTWPDSGNNINRAYYKLRIGGHSREAIAVTSAYPVWAGCLCVSCNNHFNPEEQEPRAEIDILIAKEGGFHGV